MIKKEQLLMLNYGKLVFIRKILFTKENFCLVVFLENANVFKVHAEEDFDCTDEKETVSSTEPATEH
jgi:hypothetical protein